MYRDYFKKQSFDVTQPIKKTRNTETDKIRVIFIILLNLSISDLFSQFNYIPNCSLCQSFFIRYALFTKIYKIFSFLLDKQRENVYNNLYGFLAWCFSAPNRRISQDVRHET